MSRLDNFKNIVDTRLGDIKMSEQLKQRVRDGIESAQSAGPQKKGVADFLRRQRRYLIPAAVAVACLAIFFVARPLISPGLPPDFGIVAPTTTLAMPPVALINVTAQQQNPGGVAVSSGFLLQTEGDVSEDALRQSLVVTPAIEFELEEQSDGEFVLKPGEPLMEDAIYQIALAPRELGEQPLTWVFQTESEFKLLSTLPADNSSYVPLTSGIEATFSRQITNAVGAISVSPHVDGYLEYHGKTVVFVPLSPLDPDTVYTVTLSGSLSAYTGETLGEPVSFSFRTTMYAQSDNKSSLYLANAFTEAFATGDPVPVEFLSGGMQIIESSSFDVVVYALSGADEYLEMASRNENGVHPRIGRSSDYILDTDGLTAVMSFKAELLTENEYSYFIVLPENPGAGYYLIDMRATDESVFRAPVQQKLICVSDIIVWNYSAGGESMMWLNDAASGKALEGAAVLVGDDVSAESDENGVARLEGAAGREDVIVTAADGRTFADRMWLTEPTVIQASHIYQACIYIDRAVYLPTDTVNFWGFVAPRRGGALPETLTVTLGDLAEVTVTPAADGTFSGEISFENMLSMYVGLSVEVDGQSITSTGVNIMDYIKPPYVIEAELDKPYYRRGDSITADLDVTFFDGTPAAGISVSGGGESTASGVSDEQGKLILTTRTASRHKYSFSPVNHSVYFSTSGQEDGQSYIYKNYVFFPIDYLIDYSIEEADGGSILSVKANMIDYSAVDALAQNGELDIYAQGFYDAISGPGISLPFTAEIVSHEYVRHETGTKYDFINKQTYKTYRYENVEKTVGRFNFETQNGEYISDLLEYQSSTLVSYSIIITFTLPDGWSYTREAHLSSIGNIYDSGIKRYSLAGSYLFSEDSVAQFELYENGESAENTGSLLYAIARQTPESYAVTDENTFTIECPADLIPNFTLMSAYFDGKHVYSVDQLFMRFDPAERELEIEITADKERYKPGETVTATVTVKDKTGAPRESAFVLSVADEAAFAVMEQYIDILSDLYRSVYYSYSSIYSSTVQHSLTDAFAEMGGEGDSSGVREKFVDTAAFITGSTDASGRATVTFTLPDNITSWRMTAAAVTGDLRAGMGKANVPVSLPFFVNYISNKKYAAGDDIILSARSAGTSITTGDRVSYTATLSNGQTITAEQTAAGYAYFNFGKLPVGSYTVNIRTVFGDFSDEVRLPVTVVESLLEIPVSEWIELSKIDTLKSLRYPVTLLIGDPGQSLYLDALSKMAAGGNRADQRLGRAVAQDLLSRENSDIWFDTEDDDLSNIQNYTGGVLLLPYSEADALLTAKMLVGCPELIQESAAVDYLTRILYDRSSVEEQVAAACLGLAAARQPVLLDIRLLLETGGFAQENQLLLAWGLAMLGDTQAARDWYDANLAPYATRMSPWIKIEMTGSQDGDYELTSQAAALAAACGHADSAELMRYVIDNRSGTYLPTADILCWLSQSPPASASSSFSYVRNGEVIAVDFSKYLYPVHVVQFTREQLERADFQIISGNIKALALFTAGSESIESDESGKINVGKAYQQMAGGRVRVTINVLFGDQAPIGSYTLTDVLPSGLRYVGCEQRWSSGWYLIQEDGGRLNFILYTDPQTPGGAPRISFTIAYTARIALPGEFVADSAVIRYSRGDLSFATERSVVTFE